MIDWGVNRLYKKKGDVAKLVSFLQHLLLVFTPNWFLDPEQIPLFKIANTTSQTSNDALFSGHLVAYATKQCQVARGFVQSFSSRDCPIFQS